MSVHGPRRFPRMVGYSKTASLATLGISAPRVQSVALPGFANAIGRYGFQHHLQTDIHPSISHAGDHLGAPPTFSRSLLRRLSPAHGHRLADSRHPCTIGVKEAGASAVR